MVIVTRVLVGLLGALFVLIGLGYWIDPVGGAAQVGLEPATDLGLATLRADLGGFFLVGGGLALYAAVRRNPAALWPVGALLAAAFCGRLVTLAVNGGGADSVPPMVVEAVAIGLCVLAARAWRAA